VLALDLHPDRLGELLGVELLLEALHGFAHPQVVEGDAFAREAPDGVEVARLVAPLGELRVVAKAAVVAVEAGEDGARDGVGDVDIASRPAALGLRPRWQGRRWQGADVSHHTLS